MEQELQTIKTEEIQFYEDTLLGGTDKEGTIWLAINQTCKNLGFDKNDTDNQIKKINKDEVLKMNCVKFHTVQKEGEREVNRELPFLNEEALVLWLAKISVTNNMKEKYPELSQKLTKYQLQCGKILRDYFMNTQEKKENFFDDMLNINIKELMSQNNFLISENKEIKEELQFLGSEFNEFKAYSEERNQLLYKLVKRFDIYENPKIAYTRIVNDFTAKMNPEITIDNYKHKPFWVAICNWVGLDFNILNSQKNKKDWLLQNVGIDVLNYFCDNVILENIVLVNDNYVNKQGFEHDPFGIEKKKIYSHWIDQAGNLRCCYCGKIIENPKENINYNYEHIVAKTHFGSTDTIENISIVCCDCNREKNNDYTYDEFVTYKKTSEHVKNQKTIWTNKYKK